jgi:hypothetical protein
MHGRDEQMAAVAVRDDDLRVNPEGRHHVLAVVVEVGEVGEVAGVVDGDGVAGGLKVPDHLFWCSCLKVWLVRHRLDNPGFATFDFERLI